MKKNLLVSILILSINANGDENLNVASCGGLCHAWYKGGFFSSGMYDNKLVVSDGESAAKAFTALENECEKFKEKVEERYPDKTIYSTLTSSRLKPRHKNTIHIGSNASRLFPINLQEDCVMNGN